MGILKDVADLLLPPTCCVCGAFPDADGKMPYDVPEGLHLCFNCLSSLIPQPEDRRFFTCLSEPYEGDPHPELPLYIPFPYKGFFEKAVPQMKFREHPELASFTGTLLGSYISKDKLNADLIVPIPLSAKRAKERGYNQAGLIAKGASQVCGIPCSDKVLVRVKETMRQTEITDNAVRSSNVQGAFRTDPEFCLDGLKVMLIDDVATTGNTLHEAAVALYEGGAAQVVCCAACGNRAVLNAESY